MNCTTSRVRMGRDRLSLLHGLLLLLQPCAQLLGARVGLGHIRRRRMRPPQRAIGGETAGRADDPGEEALHELDATVAALPAPSSRRFPERRPQSGPTKTV